jgi:hypothetical protein
LVATNEEVRITFRIPGNWEHPGELIEQIPDGFQLQPDSMKLPDGSEVELDLLPPDEQFFSIFTQCCRTHPTQEEIECVRNYQVNVCLTGDGGSVEAAARMMTAAAAIISAGGAGVFIDNSGVAHSGRKWLELTSDLGIDAMTFAYVSIISNPAEVWTMGMQVLGQPEIRMTKSDADANEGLIMEMMGYLATRDKPIDDGHVIADLSGPKFTVTRIQASTDDAAGNPMHNPFGQLKLTSFRDVAESN